MGHTNQSPRHYVTGELEINAPASQVWDVLADFSAVDTWVPIVLSSHIDPGVVRGVGVRRYCTVKGFGRIDEIVTDWQEGRSLSYRVSSLGPFLFTQNTWIVDETGQQSCKVTLELGYVVRLGVLGRLFNALVLGRQLKKRAPKAIEGLRIRVETGQLIRDRRSAANEPQLSPVSDKSG